MENISAWIRICFVSLIVPLVPLSGAWNPAVQVSDTGVSVQALDGPVLSVNTANNAVSAWTQNDPDFVKVITASSYVFGTGWQTPIIISSLELNQFGNPVYSGQGDPDVAMNNLGYAVVVWEGSKFIDPPQENVEGIFSATRSPDGTWSPVLNVTPLDLTFSDLNPENPIVAVNDAGLAVTTWTELADDQRYIKASFLSQGGVWTFPTILDNPPNGNREDGPYVEINERGDAVAAWKVASDTVGQKVGAATYNAGTGLWTTVDLDPSQSDIGSVPRVGIDENGNAVVVWTRRLTLVGPYEMVAASFAYGVGWGAPVVLASSTEFIKPQGYVVMDHAGNSTATWSQFEGGIEQVYASSLPLGGAWSTPEIISTDGIDNSISVGVDQTPISVDSQGNVIVIIQQSDNSLQSVARFFATGWQAPELIYIFPGTLETNIGYGSCGFAIALWLDSLFPNPPIVRAADNFGIFPPPAGFRLKKCCDKTASQKICLNNLEWDSSPGCILFYQILRNGTLVATIPGNKKPLFRDPICKKNRPVTYTLTATNIYGIESAPVTLSTP